MWVDDHTLYVYRPATLTVEQLSLSTGAGVVQMETAGDCFGGTLALASGATVDSSGTCAPNQQRGCTLVR